MPAGRFAPGGCKCDGCACKILLTITACRGSGAPGVTVNAWESSSKATLCGTGTPALVTGLLDLAVSPTLASYYVEAIPTSPRLATVSHTESCGALRVQRFLGVAAGYTCSQPTMGPGGCWEPIPTTMHFSGSTFGAATLTLSGSNFTGSSGPGGVYPRFTVVANSTGITLTYQTSLVSTYIYSLTGAPSLTCEPFAVSGALVRSGGTGAGAGPAGGTFTITE